MDIEETVRTGAAVEETPGVVGSAETGSPSREASITSLILVDNYNNMTQNNCMRWNGYL